MGQIITAYFIGFFLSGTLAIIPAVCSAVKRAFSLGVPYAD